MGGEPARERDTERGAHGGDVWGAARRRKVPVGEILDLSASLNPLGPPAGLREVLAEALGLICHYPDRFCTDLYQALAASLGLAPAAILAGNGSTALIRLLGRALSLGSIRVVAPVFGEFGRALATAGRHFHFSVLDEKRDFLPSPEQVDQLWQGDPSCLILTNPLTPSGALWETETLDRLLAEAERRRAWLVVDEAFLDFAPEAARAWSPARVERHRHLLALRSMTKFYCLAGLRLGYLLGHPATIAEFAPLAEPWGVNTLAQIAGVYCLGQEAYAQKTREVVAKWRERQAARLGELGLHVFPSQANYLLTRLPAGAPPAAEVAAGGAEQGVLFRDCANFPGCDSRHLRLAVATPEDQDRALAVLAAILGRGAAG